MSLVERLRAAMQSAPVEPPLEGDLPEARETANVRAAVLIVITDRTDPGVILTVRREHLRTHAGQVAFPGGRIDEGEDAMSAAVREAHEELLLDPAEVEVVGSIEPYRTITGYVVTPVAFLLDPANQRLRSALFQGRERHYYEIIWNERRIWGATAAMIVNLSRRLSW